MTDAESDHTLEQRLKELDDTFAARALAILDVADELHRQSNDRIDRVALQIDRNALAIDRLTQRLDQLAQQMVQFQEQAQADRAIMLQLLKIMTGQHPNGHGQSQGEG